jgi:cobalt-zinc-cadmium efflux system membrane fusion protein
MNKNSLKSTLILLYLLINFLLLTGCAESVKEIEEPQRFCLDEFIKEKITIDNALMAPVTETLALTGKVEYNPDKVINFVSLVGGVITNTYFSLGDEVKKGQLLAEIKSTELSNLLSQKRSYQSQIVVAQRELESVKAMHQDKIASQKDLIEAQSNLEVLIAELENVEAQLSLYSASSDRNVFQIKAPSSGTIVNKNIAPGMQISAEGDPLFTISDLSEVWIMADIYAGNVAYIKEDMSVIIQAFAYPDEVFSGKINALSQVFDTEERVLKARIVMDNSANMLIPGMFVDVLVEKNLNLSAVAVPAKSLIFDNDRYFLIIYKNDCEIELRTVRPSVQSTDQVFFENNLEVGEKIITKNHLLIYNHLRDLK